VPRVYLKQWASSHKKVWVYRTLVSNKNVPLWKETSIKGVAYHSNLYTRMIAGQESDEFEQWFDEKFESPAEKPILKAITGQKLTPNDWRKLIRFLAAQDVRTPVSLLQSIKRWNKSIPELLQTTLNDIATMDKDGTFNNKIHNITSTVDPKYFPLNIKTEITDGEDMGTLTAETMIGRGLWLFSINHLLQTTINTLYEHKWTILLPPKGITWFTSDCPVIKLNFHNHTNYDFRGGWGSKGTEIFLPLSPNHLLYTRVGEKPPLRGSRVSIQQAALIQRLIAENSHRMIFSNTQNSDMPTLKPRVVNKEIMKSEKEQWDNWHKEQSEAEIKIHS